MNEQTRYLGFFRKFTMCRHKYSCFEHIVRTVYKTVGFYLIARLGLKFMFKEQMFEYFSEQMKKIIPSATEKLI
jgi:hypothetical protein